MIQKTQQDQINVFFKKECKFIIGATSLDLIPDLNHPEICFVGRSNVGKSSLINKIVNNNSMARTSNTPGRTQQLNFFLLNDKLIIVDLPGYGYAKAPKENIASWNNLMRNYLIGRKNLKKTFLLIDSRIGIKKNDIEFMKMLDNSAVSYQVIFTKSDLVSKTQLEKVITELESIFLKHTALIQSFLICSSRKISGIFEIREEIIKTTGISV